MYKYGRIDIHKSQHGYNAFADIILIYNRAPKFAAKNGDKTRC